jgi:hypothetical protein
VYQRLRVRLDLVASSRLAMHEILGRHKICVGFTRQGPSLLIIREQSIVSYPSPAIDVPLINQYTQSIILVEP